jgi:murein DD-endopeptidase MepM/ murein hydrolase activator NlpD
VLVNLVLFQSYLQNPAQTQASEVAETQTSSSLGPDLEPKPQPEPLEPNNENIQPDSADVYESEETLNLAEVEPESKIQVQEQGETYQLYYFNLEDRSLLTTKLETELLTTLLKLDKPKPLGQYYYITHVEASGGDLLVSVATRQLDEVTDTTHTDPEDYFFTIKLTTSEHPQVSLFQEKSTEVELMRSRYSNYQLPWRAGEGWKVEHINPNTGKWWGWHRDAHGPALDFNPPSGSSLDILAAAPGKVTWKCSDRYGQAAMHVRTVDGHRDYGETMRYYHLNKHQLRVSTNQIVRQGQVLGKLSNMRTNHSDPGCRLPSDTVHLHLGFPYTPISLSGYRFVEGGELYAGQRLYAQQPSQIKITEPRANQTLDLSYRYAVKTDLDITRKNIQEVELLSVKTVDKLELYVNGRVVQEVTRAPYEFIWHPRQGGEVRLKVRVLYSDGTGEFSNEVKVHVRLPTSEWYSDKNLRVNYPVVMETKPSGLVVQKYLDDQGRLHRRTSEHWDILQNPTGWTDWEVVETPTEPLTTKTTSRQAETKRGSDGRVNLRLRNLNGSTSGWLADGWKSKFDPDLLEHEGRLYQTIVGTDGYIYWREIKIFEPVELMLLEG